MFSLDVFILAQLADFERAALGSRCDPSRASAALRPLVERLGTVNHKELQAIWDEFLAGRCGQARNTPAAPASEATPRIAGPQVEP